MRALRQKQTKTGPVARFSSVLQRSIGVALSKTKKLHYDVSKCLACRSCEIACAAGHSQAKTLFKMILAEERSLPRVKVFAHRETSMPIACRHCDDPQCVMACMAAAIRKDTSTGKVVYDEDRCVGCWMCVMVCPYGAIRPDNRKKIPLRCDFCPDEEIPLCVKACPTRAIVLAEEEDLVSSKGKGT
jgi:carbon-monoxide dehydrogenase iron sulfur subunit